jgi:hypothetical protein
MTKYILFPSFRRKIFNTTLVVTLCSSLHLILLLLTMNDNFKFSTTMNRQVSDFHGDNGKKLWLSVDKATRRRMLLEKWLLEQGCPKHQIPGLLKVHGADDRKELSRRVHLEYYFEDKFGSKTYLCLSPASKNTYRANKCHAKKKGSNGASDVLLSSSVRIPLNNILSSYSTTQQEPPINSMRGFVLNDSIR